MSIKTNRKLSIAFIGDISLNGRYIELNRQGINPFNALEVKLGSCDYVIGNLECLAKGDMGENLLKRPRLATSMDTLNYLQNINLKVACLAHNHVYDHLEDGFEKTTTLLKKKGIETIGAGSSILKASNPLILSFNSITLGLLNYITKDTNPNLPVEAKIFLNVFSEEKVIEDIKRIKSHVNHVVLLLHWGGRVEGGLYPDYDQPTIARKLIDAGADLIIGHHSHTFHPYEVYRGKSIFYSLGNFCFSDFTFESTSYSMPLRRMVTGIVSVSFNKNNYEVNIDFFKNKIHGFQEIPEYKRRIRSRNLIFRTLLQYYPFWLVYYFSLKNLTPLFLFIKRKDISPGTKLKRMSKSLVRRLS